MNTSHKPACHQKPQSVHTKGSWQSGIVILKPVFLLENSGFLLALKFGSGKPQYP